MRCLKDAYQILNADLLAEQIQSMNLSELMLLSEEVRDYIIKVMSENPGHLGASLGTVELTLALLRRFNFKSDQLVWDVGHQSYAYKILTGRYNQFTNIRQFNAISGFPSMQESSYDHFGTGHSSTSISAVLGKAMAFKAQGVKSKSIAIIGDGALTGGMAFEALNHLSSSTANVLVILNDNNMSIDPNVGGLQEHLNSIDPTNNVFTNIGLNYAGPIDGHDLEKLDELLKKSVEVSGPQILHIRTQKGFGYASAEKGNPTHWHAPGKFDIETGSTKKEGTSLPLTYQEVVGKTLVHLGDNEDFFVITPAMASGSKLNEFKRWFPNRLVDVGIAEQHAVTLAAGMASVQSRVFCVVYSTFLQRAYDQIIHDVALQNLDVTFLIDRAGLVGNDGATHHGAFDLAYLNAIPNIKILTPLDERELSALLCQSLKMKGPVAIRYPRGKGVLEESFPIQSNKESKLVCRKQSNEGIAVISIGAIGAKLNALHENTDIEFAHYHLIQSKPLPESELEQVYAQHEKVLIIEDGVLNGGIAQSIAYQFREKITEILAIPDQFIKHGSQDELYASIGMDALGIEQFIKGHR